MRGGSVKKDPEPIKREPGNLIDDVFSENEMKTIYHFIDFGNRRTSYRKFIKDGKSDSSIYRWFNKEDVQNKIIEISQSLAIYDTVADKQLLRIISSSTSSDKDKIAAIKVWNDLRKRVHQTIILEQNTKLDLSNVSDENLEAVVNKIMKLDNDTKSK